MKLFRIFGGSKTKPRGDCGESAIREMKSGQELWAQKRFSLVNKSYWLTILSVLMLMTTSMQVFAYENGTPDCGSDEFNVGEVVAPEDCTYPEVFNQVLDFGDAYDYMWVGGTHTLIYKDEHKAVTLTAAHIIRDLQGSSHERVLLSVSPQGSTPFEVAGNPNGFYDKIRPYNIQGDLLPVSAMRGHPLFSISRQYDIGVFFIEMTDEVKALLEGIEPVQLPDCIDCLSAYKDKDLNAIPLTSAGYSRVTADIYGEDSPEKVGGSWKRLVPAKGNRQYGPVDVAKVGDTWIDIESKITKDQLIVCYGDSGSSIFLNDYDNGGNLISRTALAVSSTFSGTCAESVYNRYDRIDVTDVMEFLQCAIDSSKTIEESLDCIDAL